MPPYRNEREVERERSRGRKREVERRVEREVEREREMSVDVAHSSGASCDCCQTEAKHPKTNRQAAAVFWSTEPVGVI